MHLAAFTGYDEKAGLEGLIFREGGVRSRLH